MSRADKVRTCPAYFVQIAEVMVRTGVSLKQAAVEVGHPLDPDEAELVGRRRDFSDILRNERNKYNAMVANDPSRTKSSLLGRMAILADRLTAEGELDKAAVVLEKLAKIEGWAGADSNVNVFSGLTARDLLEARERLTGGTPQVATKESKEDRKDPGLAVN